MGVYYFPDGGFKYSASSVAEAKVVLRELRLKKKEVALAKREVTAKQREVRSQYTGYVRRRGSKLIGGGGVGHFIRALQTVDRDAKRRDLAQALEPLQQEADRLDRLIAALDQALLNLEGYVLREA